MVEKHDGGNRPKKTHREQKNSAQSKNDGENRRYRRGVNRRGEESKTAAVKTKKTGTRKWNGERNEREKTGAWKIANEKGSSGTKSIPGKKGEIDRENIDVQRAEAISDQTNGGRSRKRRPTESRMLKVWREILPRRRMGCSRYTCRRQGKIQIISSTTPKTPMGR